MNQFRAANSIVSASPCKLIERNRSIQQNDVPNSYFYRFTYELGSSRDLLDKNNKDSITQRPNTTAFVSQTKKSSVHGQDNPKNHTLRSYLQQMAQQF